MGNNQVLTPNIYTIGAASTLNGNLILDAQGDPNAKFVIKIDGALTSSAFSSISLINFASVCNVYWQINGLFSLADSSIFRGTLLINGAINLYNGSILEGRALSVAGAINIDNVIADITCLNSALPICLTSFQASCDAGQPLVNWSTSSEMNNNYFILYRSQDGKLWEPAAQLKGAGNSLVQKNYSIIDHSSFSAFTYYRLMQMDYNGKYEYSSIVWIKSCNKNKSLNQVYPNPTKGIIKFKHIESKYNTYSLAIYNSSGNMVYFSKKFKKSVDLSMFENGRYTILFSTDGINSVQEIVLSK